MDAVLLQDHLTLLSEFGILTLAAVSHNCKATPRLLASYSFAATDGGTRATFVGTYASAEDLQKVLDMGVVEGSTLAINQIDDLLAS